MSTGEPKCYPSLMCNLRWRLRFTNRTLVIRAGFFGLEIHFGSVVPLSNNVSVDERKTGIILYPIPLHLTPGASVRGLRLIKSQILDEVE